MTKIRFGFKQILLFSTWLLVITTVCTSGYISYQQLQKTTDSLVGGWVEYGLDKDVMMIKSTFEHRIDAIKRFTEPYQSAPLNVDRDEIVKLVGVLADLTNLDSAVIAFDNGQAFWNHTSAEWPEHRYQGDATELDWYQFARRADEPMLSDPFVDEGVTYISVVQALSNGVVTLDFDTAFMQTMMDQVTEDRPGVKAAILTKDGFVLASSFDGMQANQPLSASSPGLQRLVKQTTAQSGTSHKINYAGGDHLFASENLRIANQDYSLLLGIDSGLMFTELRASERQAFLTTLVVTLVAMVLYFVLLKLAYKPVLELKGMILSLAEGEGDLTRRLSVKGEDDLAQMGEGINRFIAHIQGMMKEVTAVAHGLKNQVTELNNHSHHSANVLSRHAAETDQVLAAVEEMSVTADNVAQDAGESANFTREADTLGQDCSGMASNATHSLAALLQEVNQSEHSIQSMTDETRSITQVLDVIGEIADQTNLLALNAAIEAARAGEHGRGFAVVADEVRALASRTQSSTNEIELALQRLSENNGQVVQAMDATKVSVNALAQNSGAVGDEIGKLSSHLNQVTGLSARIATAAEEQSSVTREISRNMSAIREIVDDLAHTGEQVVVHSQEVDRASEQLTTMVAKFTL